MNTCLAGIDGNTYSRSAAIRAAEKLILRKNRGFSEFYCPSCQGYHLKNSLTPHALMSHHRVGKI